MPPPFAANIPELFDHGALRAAVASCLGGSVLSIGPKLNVKSDMDVVRVELDGDRPTVIAKVPRADISDRRRRMLRAEAINLRIVAQGHVPRHSSLLGVHEDTLLLRDVGGVDERFPTVARAEAAVADALAMLHGGTRRVGMAWQSAHAQAGTLDIMLELSDAQERRVERGIALLADRAPAVGVEPADVRELIRDANWQLRSAPDQQCLVHDDFASGRQATILGGEVWILDFERARMGHPFLDVARTLIGELAVRWPEKVPAWRVLDFEPRFVDRYLDAWARWAPGTTAGESATLVAAVVCVAMELLGACLEVGPDLEPDLRSTVAALLRRTVYVLGAVPSGARAARVLSPFAGLSVSIRSS